MRPNRNLRELVNWAGAIDVAIYFFIFDSTDNLVASRVVIFQGLHIVNIVRKNYIVFALFEFLD